MIRYGLIAVVLLFNTACVFDGPSKVREAKSPKAGKHESATAAQVESVLTDISGADSYLETMTQFSAADEHQRNTLYERASVAAALKTSADHRLRLALLKLVPGHHGHNPRAAETLLRSVVKEPNDLPAGVINLAVVYLKLSEEHNRLRSANRQLEKQLEEANAKLEALTRIEQSVDLPTDEPLDQSSDPETDE